MKLTYCLHRSILVLCGTVFAALASADVENYGYPIKDRFAATIVGTPTEFEADLPEDIPFHTKRIVIFPDRETPDVVWYNHKMAYSQALQKGNAPLIFLIAGTGASHNGGKNRNMAKAFYQAGFHVVSLSSPTLPNFVVSASSTGVVGHAQRDAEDLYRAMEMIWKKLDGKISASSFNLTGYSLGAFNSAFVAKLDETRGVFNFNKVLLINSPVSLYSSISLLDRMIENIPGGVDHVDSAIEKLLHSVSDVYTESDNLSGDEFLFKVYQEANLKDEQLAALIGISFRLSSASQTFTSDVMADYGYIKPKGLKLGRYSDLTQYNAVAKRLGFSDYYHEFFYPFYRNDYPGKTRDEVTATMSLEAISDYLRSATKITAIHNVDDVILETGEIDFFRETFGDRARIYPLGGHCGNMNYIDNVAHMVSTFTAMSQ